MIVLGPLLILVDGIKTLYDQNIAEKYMKQHLELIAQFNCTKNHAATSNFMGTPVLRSQTLHIKTDEKCQHK